MRTRDILLVEDSDDDADLTVMAFRDANISNTIVRVRDGVEALDYMFRREPYTQRELPAVILLDLKLPRVNGIEVLRRLRAEARTQHVPVVVLTSSAEERDRIDAYASHANSYVRKPVDYDDFVAATRLLGMYWTVTNLPAPTIEDHHAAASAKPKR